MIYAKLFVNEEERKKVGGKEMQRGGREGDREGKGTEHRRKEEGGKGVRGKGENEQETDKNKSREEGACEGGDRWMG